MVKIPIILTSLILCGCTSNVEVYLRSKEPVISSLEIIEISKEDSAYSTNDQLNHILALYSEYNLEITNLLTKAESVNSKKESILFLDSAINIYENTHVELDSIAHKCYIALDFPILKHAENNRKCIKAKYRLNGKLIEEIFYFKKNKHDIDHSENDNRELARRVLLEKDNYYNRISNIEEYKSNIIEYGKLDSWKKNN